MDADYTKGGDLYLTLQTSSYKGAKIKLGRPYKCYMSVPDHIGLPTREYSQPIPLISDTTLDRDCILPLTTNSANSKFSLLGYETRRSQLGKYSADFDAVYTKSLNTTSRESGIWEDISVIVPTDEGGTIATREWAEVIQHQAYYDSIRDMVAVWGDNNGSIIVVPENTTDISIIRYAGNSTVKVVAIPNSVRTINATAFADCSSLNSIALPPNLTSIGASVFSGCSSLTGIKIPKNVAVIQANTFEECKKLKTITLPSGLKTLGDGAFRNCSALSSIIIPESVTNIPDNLLNGCILLDSVVLPTTLTSIGEGAFNGCYSLKTINIPATVDTIESEAFEGCSNSELSLVVPATVKTIGSYAFGQVKKVYMGHAIDNPPSGTDWDVDAEAIYWYSELEPTTPGKFWRYVDGVPTPWPELDDGSFHEVNEVPEVGTFSLRDNSEEPTYYSSISEAREAITSTGADDLTHVAVGNFEISDPAAVVWANDKHNIAILKDNETYTILNGGADETLTGSNLTLGDAVCFYRRGSEDNMLLDFAVINDHIEFAEVNSSGSSIYRYKAGAVEYASENPDTYNSIEFNCANSIDELRYYVEQNVSISQPHGDYLPSSVTPVDFVLDITNNVTVDFTEHWTNIKVSEPITSLTRVHIANNFGNGSVMPADIRETLFTWNEDFGDHTIRVLGYATTHSDGILIYPISITSNIDADTPEEFADTYDAPQYYVGFNHESFINVAMNADIGTFNSAYDGDTVMLVLCDGENGLMHAVTNIPSSVVNIPRPVQLPGTYTELESDLYSPEGLLRGYIPNPQHQMTLWTLREQESLNGESYSQQYVDPSDSSCSIPADYRYLQFESKILNPSTSERCVLTIGPNINSNSALRVVPTDDTAGSEIMEASLFAYTRDLNSINDGSDQRYLINPASGRAVGTLYYSSANDNSSYHSRYALYTHPSEEAESSYGSQSVILLRYNGCLTV